MGIKLTLLLSLVVLLPTLAVGQLTTREIKDLRAKLKLPDSDKVRNQPTIDFPDNKKIRVFLAVTTPGSDQKYFRKKLAEWNQERAAQFGEVEEVSSVNDADVVLTQFMSTISKVVETTSVGSGMPGTSFPSVGLGSPRRRVEPIDLPIYSYLIVREQPLWTIVYSHVEASDTARQHSNPTLRLWSAFDTRMRSR